MSAAITRVAFCGALSGQLFIGWLGDKLGHEKVYGITLMLMVICSIAIGLSFGHTAKGVMATLCLFRFCLGFGIGGDYLVSATIMSEYANKKTRGAFIAVVFTTQGFGILTGGIVSIIISAAFKERFDYPAYRDNRAGSTVPEADYIWCTTLMLGALPAALTYYWRMKMPETARYTALVAKNAKRAAPECRVGENMKAKPLKEGSSELMYMDIKLHGQTTHVMVDMGATHNFIDNREAMRLGLILEKNPSRMKAVNSEAK
ncbi:probable inorganic phosphate transporter 1-4 [Musa acuminata AAA Group]|uniref:probable inorganic phosphate transporter 1-4 n=1 Tax=Musa acuminata AAA Group TaxID=214697 RepID=UPI0031E440AE